ncbi:Splicing factor-like protein [Trema orientale]|uniref:Splicing factor-like protein n=1 Tax=Trema orientale TaxID=63057 RepID=A0A2P5FVG4_TREOI|nr:Splicing factor-like protein [Trema orientale]
MARREDNRVFVGGLAWETTDRQLEDAFTRYGKILECVVVADRDTSRPRGFGFVTFADHRAMDEAISDMHGRELNGRVISVNKAKPKLGGGDAGLGHDRDYISGGRRSAGRTSDCFKCGRPGHFARECPLGDGGGRFSSEFGSGRGDGRGDHFPVDHFDDRLSRGRYGDRDRFDGRESRYESHDRYINDRYSERYAPPVHDSYAGDRYVERELQNEYARGRGYFRDGGPRPGGDRYGSGGPDRFGRGSYRDKTGPYDRQRKGDHLLSYDRF